MDKKKSRIRRAGRTRGRIRVQRVNRISVFRTPRHIYVQLIDPDGNVLASASTLDKSLRTKLKATGNIDAAAAVGKLIAERAQKAGIKDAAFDRSGFRYHGRIKALADAAREGGMNF